MCTVQLFHLQSAEQALRSLSFLLVTSVPATCSHPFPGFTAPLTLLC